MPELPEIEHLKRSLQPVLLDSKVTRVQARRHDVIHPPAGQYGQSTDPARSCDLLGGTRIVRLHRHGKQLALEAANGRVVCIHLGMSGQLLFLPWGAHPENRTHIHCQWTLDGPAGRGRLIFRDPRRFGGLWCFTTSEALHLARWAQLGPDALHISTRALSAPLRTTQRPIKSALLDQTVLAGVGNIYADESLFRAGIHPCTPGQHLQHDRIRCLAGALRRILDRAVRSGGSSLRDYRDAQGTSGRYARRHCVYGRTGQPCTRCGDMLMGIQVAQRTTVYCPTCQS